MDTTSNRRSLPARARDLLYRFRRADRGSALIYAAALMAMLTLAGGAVVDGGRSYLVKSRLSQSIDAAALAGGRILHSDNRDNEIRAFFAANYPTNYLGATATPLAISADLAANTITITVSASLPTSVMSIAGIRQLTVHASTTVKLQSTGMELALVMDNTWSMNDNDKMPRMKSAAKDLLDILYGNSDTSPNLWVGLVPFVTAVNIGPLRTDWLTSYMVSNYSPVGWMGCVEARPSPYEEEQADEPPTGSTKFKPYFWPSNKGVVYRDRDNDPIEDNDRNVAKNDNPYANVLYASSPSLNRDYGIRQTAGQTDQRGPNAGCHWSKITPLQPSKAVAKTAVDDMQVGSSLFTGTHTTVGTAWGWRLLSPKWRGYWSDPTPANMPFDYNTGGMLKVVVILTDGENTAIDRSGRPPGCSGLRNCPSSLNDTNYGAYGRLSENRFGLPGSRYSAEGMVDEIDARQTRLCNAMKAQGIIVMTILLEVDSTSTRDLFRNCATKPEYAFTPTSMQLSTVFSTIANELSALRIYK